MLKNSAGAISDPKFSNGVTLLVNKKSASVTFSASTITKVYDGTANVSGNPVLGVVGAAGDDVLSAKYTTATYDSAHAANATTITFAGISLVGDKASNYTVGSTYSVPGTITPLDLATTTLSVNASGIMYDGSAPVPAVTVKLGNMTVNPSDYTITRKDSYDKPAYVTHTVTVTGNGDCTGTATKSIEIEKLALGGDCVRITPAASVYNGAEQQPNVSVSYVNGTESKPLVEGRDYRVSLANSTPCEKPGEYELVVTGIGYCMGTVPSKFVISPKSVSLNIGIPSDKVYYTGEELTPDVVVTREAFDLSPSAHVDAAVLKAGTDYRVSYLDNKNPGMATISVELISDCYVASATRTFEIAATPLADAQVTLQNTTYMYDKTAHEPAVIVTFDGKPVASSEYSVSYKNNRDVGTAQVIITGNGKFTGSVTREFTIASKAVTPAISVLSPSMTYTGSALKPRFTVKVGSETLDASQYEVTHKDNVNAGKASFTVKLKGNYSGEATGGFTIVPASAKPVVMISNKPLAYTGKSLTPAISVTYDGRQLSPGEYMAEYASNKNPGTARVTVTLLGNYTGSATQTFTINPKATKISKVKAAKKALKVTWKKQASQTTGYQVAYSLKKNFKSVKYVNVGKSKTTSSTIKGLKGGKRYYVKVRTYKVVGGIKYFSSWSKVLSATAKK